VNLSLDTDKDPADYFVNFTHVRNDDNFHIYIRLSDIKSWESIAKSGGADRSTRWKLTTIQGDIYYTLNSFNEIMTTSRKYPRTTDGSGHGRVGDAYLYRNDE